MQVIVFLAAVAAFLAAAWGDLRRRRIPNALPLALAALGLLRMTLLADPAAALYTLAAGAAVLLVGFLLFSFGFAGGGDAKLLAGATLLVGAHDLPAFLLLMSLVGGVLALAVILHGKLRPWLGLFAVAALTHARLGTWLGRRPRLAGILFATAAGPRASREGARGDLAAAGLPAAAPGFGGVGGSLARAGSRPTVPYGVAIAAAGIVILSLQLSLGR